MTITILADLVPSTHPILGGPMQAKYIVIHNTGNASEGANAEMHGHYLRSQDAISRDVLWHFTVDDKEIRQHLPVSINGWHASDGYGPGNMTGIGIEICEQKGIDMAQAEANAARLCAHLIKTVPSLLPFPECLKRHHDFARDKKFCPRVIMGRPGGWEGFVAAVKALLEPKTPPRRVTHMGEVVECAARDENGTTAALIVPILQGLKGRVLEGWTYDKATNTVDLRSRPERPWWKFRIL